MSNPWGQLPTMLVGQAPLLIVYLGGLILCLVMWGRHPRPALLAFLGCTILFAVTLGYPFVHISLIVQRSTVTSVTRLSTMLSMLTMATSIIRAAGFILLLCAVFAARQPASLPAFPVGNVGPYPPALPPRR